MNQSIKCILPFILITLLSYNHLYAQSNTFTTSKLKGKIKIDGKLDETAWDLKEYYLTQTVPDNGEPSKSPIQLSIKYDEIYLYLAAKVHVNSAEEINNTMTFRDALNNTDYFGLTLDPFGLATEGYSFILTPSGVQYDSKYGGDGSEYSEWNAVWYSETIITETGWSVEMKIPFNFLRFDKDNLDNFKFNIVTFRSNVNEQAWWSPIDATQPGFLNQFGNLKGIKDIAPPINLTFLPFANLLIDKNNIENTTELDFAGGLDIKYVYKNAFTVDASIIPDFSQTTFDNAVLNLSAFEIRFDENRQFFTEGTEILNKSNFFYSRRIGESPYFFAPFIEGDELVEDPGSAQILNLVKLTAKTKNGFGLSLLNGFVNREFAKYASGREELVNPYTNYNSIAMEQVLKNNSFIYFANSSVIREGDVADFNLSELRYRQFTKEQKYTFDADVSLSQNYAADDTTLGYFYRVTASKSSGSYRASISHEAYDEKFNPNDFGFLTRNNLSNYNGSVSYTKFNPFWILNRFSVSLSYSQNYYKSLGIREASIGQINFEAVTKKNHTFNIGSNFRLEGKDFFEPRVVDRFSRISPFIEPYIEFISNTNKDFFAQLYGFYKNYSDDPYNHEIRLGYQLNKVFGTRLTVNLNQDLSFLDSNMGVIFLNGSPINDDNSINYVQRDIYNLTTNINTNYLITNTMGLSLKLRHFWAYVENKNLFLVDERGNYEPNSLEVDLASSQINYNLFNLDFLFRWQFTPGSELSINWQKSITGNDTMLETNFGRNIKSTFNNRGIDTFSFKIVYFLDYNTIKKTL
ncbi:DUF5916 domain-containing protein [Kordia sp.]|uniref:DUF5916 domain-containing protein n=1 Tax=Kordia sp. TaxID=1965332 RepID=UPI003D2E3C0E